MRRRLHHFAFDRLQTGDVFPEFEIGPFTKADCERLMDATDDHHPIHNDREYAVAAGMPDIVVPGLLILAHASRFLTNQISPYAIRSIAARFKSVTHPGERLTVVGSVTDKWIADGEHQVGLDLRVADTGGGVKLSGNAVVAVSRFFAGSAR